MSKTVSKIGVLCCLISVLSGCASRLRGVGGESKTRSHLSPTAKELLDLIPGPKATKSPTWQSDMVVDVDEHTRFNIATGCFTSRTDSSKKQCVQPVSTRDCATTVCAPKVVTEDGGPRRAWIQQYSGSHPFPEPFKVVCVSGSNLDVADCYGPMDPMVYQGTQLGYDGFDISRFQLSWLDKGHLSIQNGLSLTVRYPNVGIPGELAASNVEGQEKKQLLLFHPRINIPTVVYHQGKAVWRDEKNRLCIENAKRAQCYRVPRFNLRKSPLYRAIADHHTIYLLSDGSQPEKPIDCQKFEVAVRRDGVVLLTSPAIIVQANKKNPRSDFWIYYTVDLNVPYEVRFSAYLVQSKRLQRQAIELRMLDRLRRTDASGIEFDVSEDFASGFSDPGAQISTWYFDSKSCESKIEKLKKQVNE